MRILFLSRWFPYPPDNGSKIRVSTLLAGLCRRHDVTLISFYDPAETRADPGASGPAPREVQLCPYREFAPSSGRALLGYLSSTPRYLVDTHNPDMARLIEQALGRSRFDLVIASQLSMAAYYESFRGVPAVFEEVELGVYWPEDTVDDTPWNRARRRLTWAKHSRYVARLLERFTFCTVASEAERRLVNTAAPGYTAVHVVPNSVSAAPAGLGEADRVPGSLIFTGSLRYAPNHDAMAWFVNEVFPAIRDEVPQARLTITGDAGTRRLPPTENVVLAGHVADIRSLVAASAVSLAPIRAGGGTRLKILEAMAVRTPVVATTKAVEGIDARHGEHLLIADTPRDFAEAVNRLLKDPAGARAMAARAARLYRSRYDSQLVVPEFLRLVEQAAA